MKDFYNYEKIKKNINNEFIHKTYFFVYFYSCISVRLFNYGRFLELFYHNKNILFWINNNITFYLFRRKEKTDEIKEFEYSLSSRRKMKQKRDFIKIR